jgi:hypothetical protein
MQIPGHHQPGRETRLLDSSAAALNQNDQNNNKQHSGDNLDNRASFHNNSLSRSTCFMRSRVRKGSGSRPAELVMLHSAAGRQAQAVLLDSRAAALNQNDQDDDKQHSGDNLDYRASFHIDSSFP